MTIVNATIRDKAFGFFSNNRQIHIDTADIQTAVVSYDHVFVKQVDSLRSQIVGNMICKELTVLRKEEDGLAAALHNDKNFKSFQKHDDETGLYVRSSLIVGFKPIGGPLSGLGRIVLSNGELTAVIDKSASPDKVLFNGSKKVSISESVVSTFRAMKSLVKNAPSTIKNVSSFAGAVYTNWVTPKPKDLTVNPFSDPAYRKTHRVKTYGTRFEYTKS